MDAIVLLKTFLLLEFISICTAINCLECHDIPRPDVCGKSVQCHANSNCFIREYITTSGNPLFSTGCISNQLCGAISKRHFNMSLEAEDASKDVDVCLECCDGSDYCNNNGCGITIKSEIERGPYCFNCDVENDVAGCRTIKQCDLGFDCTTVFNTTQLQDEPSGHIKRALTIPIPYCCANDYCNDILKYTANQNVSVDGGWSVWTDWSACSKTCGHGHQIRTRSCDNPSPQNGGATCQGDTDERRTCMNEKCEVNGAWSEWGKWSSCSVTCGSGGQISRSRTCDNPTPANNGAYCHGNNTENMDCPLKDCNDHRCKSVGFQHINNGKPLCLKFNSQRTSWSDAQRHCAATPGARLFVVNDDDEQRALKEIIHGNIHEQRCSNAGFHYINHIHHHEPICLQFYPHSASWSDAQRDCAATPGARLFVVNGDDKQTILMDMIQNNLHGDTAVWIGLHGPEHGHNWAWVDQIHYSYNNFNPQPKSPHHDDCACVLKNGEWHVCRCREHHPYICQLPI